MTKSKSLSINTSDITKLAFKDIKSEIANDRIGMVRDYVKGAYWYVDDLKSEIKKTESRIKDVDDAIDSAEKGDFQQLKNIKVPAKYLSEKTVRMNDIDWEDNS